jgi:hypothetical protein
MRERLLADAHPCPYMVMWSGRGKRLGQVPNGPASDPDRGSAVVRRGWLHEVLRTEIERAVPSHSISPRGSPPSLRSATTASAPPSRTATAPRPTSSSAATGSAPPPAASSTRTPRRRPYTGLVSVGGFARHPAVAPTPDTQHFVFGRRSFFGYLMRSGGEIYWFANVTHPEPAPGQMRTTSTEQWLTLLRDLHARDPDPVPTILAANSGPARG